MQRQFTRGFLLPGLAFFQLSMVVPAFAASVNDWRHDIDELAKDIVVVHPEPFVKVGRLRFLRESAALKAALPELTEEQRMVGAMRLVALLQDGHTQLEPASSDFGRWYPIRIFEFSDGTFIVSAYKDASELVGAQILEVAGAPVTEALDAARSLMGADNAFNFKENVYPFNNAGLMKGLGYASSDGSLKVKLRLRGGQVVQRNLTPEVANSPDFDSGYSGFDWRFYNFVFGTPLGTVEEWTTAYKGLSTRAFLKPDLSRPPFLNFRGNFSKVNLSGQGAYFIQVNVVQNGKENLVDFFHQAMAEVDKVRPTNLIVDLRNSPGGDGSKVAPILREFTSRRTAQPWKSLYVLVSRRTFSATVFLLKALVTSTEATVIGEPAGAPWNADTDTVQFNLKRAHLTLEVAARHHQEGDSDDTRAFIPVDIPASFSFSDFANGHDPALDPILQGEEMRAIPLIALADGGIAARRAYLLRKKKFAANPAWAPPSESELRRSGLALQSQNRTSESIETFKLSTEVHPDEWHSWYNLAEAQWHAGLKRDALKSYSTCLDLNDPTNFNRERLEKLIAEARNSPENSR